MPFSLRFETQDFKNMMENCDTKFSNSVSKQPVTKRPVLSWAEFPALSEWLIS
jgi:hypothetical protein